jgi:hypothetical protein
MLISFDFYSKELLKYTTKNLDIPAIRFNHFEVEVDLAPRVEGGLDDRLEGPLQQAAVRVCPAVAARPVSPVGRRKGGLKKFENLIK